MDSVNHCWTNVLKILFWHYIARWVLNDLVKILWWANNENNLELDFIWPAPIRKKYHGSFHVKSTRKMDTHHRFCRNVVSTYLGFFRNSLYDNFKYTCSSDSSCTTVAAFIVMLNLCVNFAKTVLFKRYGVIFLHFLSPEHTSNSSYQPVC